MRYAESYKELDVYKLARTLSKEIYQLSARFPREEKYSLTDQIRRSSRSVGGQIAEAWARRKYVRHFVSKLTDADGEQLETQHWIDTAHDCLYVSDNDWNRLGERYRMVGRMLSTMMRKASTFCKQ